METQGNLRTLNYSFERFCEDIELILVQAKKYYEEQERIRADQIVRHPMTIQVSIHPHLTRIKDYYANFHLNPIMGLYDKAQRKMINDHLLTVERNLPKLKKALNEIFIKQSGEALKDLESIAKEMQNLDNFYIN